MIQVWLNPMERTLYRLFLAHPEGIRADDLVLHWKELCEIYAEESCFDDPSIREDKLESLCAESKKVFYSNVSRIKRKFVKVLGPWQADPYIIKNEGGLYMIKKGVYEEGHGIKQVLKRRTLDELVFPKVKRSELEKVELNSGAGSRARWCRLWLHGEQA